MESVTLKSKGYRYISRKHKIAARIDRPDWKEHMAKMAMPWDEDAGLIWVELFGRMAPDYYRRVYSKDRVVTQTLFRGIPNSTGDTTGYIA